MHPAVLASSVQIRLISRNGFAKFVGLLLFPFLKLPLHGLNFAFGTPPFGASPDAQHSAAIGKPNTDGLIAYRFWIIDHVWLGSHFAVGIGSKRFHNFDPERRLYARRKTGCKGNLVPFGPIRDTSRKGILCTFLFGALGKDPQSPHVASGHRQGRSNCYRRSYLR